MQTREELTLYFLRLHQEHFDLLGDLLGNISGSALWAANPEGVSIGHLIGHVCEMEQFWIDWGLCGEPYERDSQHEFDRPAEMTAAALLQRLRQRCARTQQRLNALSDEQWTDKRLFHGDRFTGAGILLWHLQHLALHRGHIEAHKRWQTSSEG
jgi:uncharacterized damage-inducible protein DinB